jgi:hypothetical protein
LGLKEILKIKDADFENFDKLHYKTENRLLSLVKALQSKRKEGSWDQEIHDTTGKYVT